MNYLLLCLLLLPYWSVVPSKVGGLGSYLLGITTPESLDKSVFKEEDQVYAKGTLTLACSHIRLFRTLRLDVEGIRVINLSLAFYDNKLYAISCDYNPALKNAFVAKHGKGNFLSKISLSSCINRQDKPLLIGGESWKNGDIQAAVVRVEGYNSDCRQEADDWLMIASQRAVALSSDCDLGTRRELYDRLLNAQRP